MSNPRFQLKFCWFRLVSLIEPRSQALKAVTNQCHMQITASTTNTTKSVCEQQKYYRSLIWPSLTDANSFTWVQCIVRIRSYFSNKLNKQILVYDLLLQIEGNQAPFTSKGSKTCFLLPYFSKSNNIFKCTLNLRSNT